MKIKTVKFEKIHAYEILDRSVREDDFWLSGQDWERAIDIWAEEGPAYTMIIDDQLVACGGVTLLGWRRGEAWILLSPLFSKYPKSTYVTVKASLDGMIEDNNLRRVQAIVNPEFPAHSRFLKHLGFEYEGTLRSYGINAEDLFMFGRII